MNDRPTIRPGPKSIEAYDYDDVIDWIEQKYGIKIRDFAGKFGPPSPEEFKSLIPPNTEKGEEGTPPYLDFWHWIIDGQFYGDVHNGSYGSMQLRPEEGFEAEWASQPTWVNAILKMIDDEFPECEGQMEVWIAW